MIAESFERIHRSNLVGMGVLPLQFADGESAESLGLTGEEDVRDHRPRRAPTRGAARGDGQAPTTRSSRRACASTRRRRRDYFRHGGILPYVLRQLLASLSHG